MHSGTNKCFSETELGALLEGRLSEEEKNAFFNHIFTCRDCRDEFISITGALVQKDSPEFGEVPQHLIEKAVDLFPEKESVFDIVISTVKEGIDLIFSGDDFEMSAPAFAGSLRGKKSKHPEIVVLKKSFEDMDVELDIENVGGDLCDIRLAVDDIRRKILMNTLRVELISGERELASNLLENGETVLEDIGTGNYIIKIKKNGRIFGEIALKIK